MAKKFLEKRERSLGVKLSRKGERSNSPKAAIVRKPYKPGQHGRRYSKTSEFGQQLREKQKVKFSYGVTERQLKRIVNEVSSKTKEGEVAADEAIVDKLERRLDNVVMRLGFTEGRNLARQLVAHGHFLVNGRRVKASSYKVKVGDKISIRPQSKEIVVFQSLSERLKKYEPPVWLKMNPETLEGEVVSEPKDVDAPFDISFVVDYYSRK